ncbi:hypothetical protein SCHPADRAFT_910827 [Schizopora paradoxa]|uniref:Uncharacterized protein n=1 Tax=Schizopora paradoxa TaxID=27342 RepID=A0A0H2R1U3_9AGAM|nr:hypothetical protein SCHPADRAFT_910827 [Schizopora paradoxa]
MSTSMFTNVNGSGKGKERETPSPSPARSASMASSSSVKIESDASVRPRPSILTSFSKLIPSFLSPQQQQQQQHVSLNQASPVLPAVQTPLTHINNLRDRDRTLDTQVQDFLSAAGQIQAGAELVQRLCEELKAKDIEIAELKQKNEDLNQRVTKMKVSMTKALEASGA